MHLISSKLTIPDEWATPSRDRLIDTLQESVDGGTSTLITGRSGTGKTTLAAEFCRRTARRVAWYDVDATDADPRVFFAYLFESIHRQRPGFGRQLTPFADVVNGDDMQTLANLFIYELLEHPGDLLVVVIDNLHRIYDAPWSAPFLVRLLPLLPFDTHVVMIGRGLPPAPLWRLRSKQTLHVIEEATLAFTPHDVRDLFELYRQSDLDVHDILQLTHGRASLVDSAVREGPPMYDRFGFLQGLQALL